MYAECVKIYVFGVKMYVVSVKMYVESVKKYVEGVKFLESVNFLESWTWRLTLEFLDDLELDRYFGGTLRLKLYTTIVAELSLLFSINSLIYNLF